MIINSKMLTGLPVQTRSGLQLGRVADFEVETESHLVATYIVRPGRLTRPLARQTLRISRTQVLSITAERMIVDDNTPTEAVQENRRANFSKEISPAIPSRTA